MPESRQPFRQFADFTGSDPRFRDQALDGPSFTAIDPAALRGASSLVFVTGPSPEPVLTITPDGDLIFRDATEAAQAIKREWDRLRGLETPPRRPGLAQRLLTCAEQSEMGRNFADTPHACREAAAVLGAVPEPAAKPTPADLGFVDRSEGGHGRTSIKKSHRAEGRNFVD